MGWASSARRLARGGGGSSPTSSRSAGLLLPVDVEVRHREYPNLQDRTNYALKEIVAYEDAAGAFQQKIWKKLREGDNDIEDTDVASEVANRDLALEYSVRWRNQAPLSIGAKLDALTGQRADVESVVFAVGQILDRQPDTKLRLLALESAKMLYP